MKTNVRKLLEATLAASVFAFAGNVAAQATQDDIKPSTSPAMAGDGIKPPVPVTPNEPTTSPSQPYRVALNEPRPVVVDPFVAPPLFRDRWDIPYKDLVFERELSRTDGEPQGDPLNPLVPRSASGRY
jgi:hypothetical protein